jgi:uncharacterized protein YndB with AHSA1/START domain
MKITGTAQVTEPSEREFTFLRDFAAPRGLVWDVWTNPKHITRWMLGPDGWNMPVCEVDFRVGGAQRFVWRRVEGNEMEIRGVYQEIVPPERLVSTESWGEGWPETRNTLLLTENNRKTTMAFTMLYPSKEARDAALKTGMKDGMARSFDRLDNYLQTLK